MNKKWIVGLISGAVIAAGVGVWAVGSGSITIDKVENFNVTLSEAAGDAVAGLGQMLGGISNLDILELDAFRLNKKSATTTENGVFRFEGNVIISGSENQESIMIDEMVSLPMGGSACIDRVAVIFPLTTASTTMRFDAATSTASTLTEYTYTPLNQSDNIFHILIATSTYGFNDSGSEMLVATTSPRCIEQGSYVNFMLTAGSSFNNNPENCGAIGANKCEAATSTATGLKPIHINVRGFATSTVNN